MLQTRVIPILSLSGSGLVKTTQFKNPQYVGDCRNAVKIFNEKEVDELCLLDITATLNNSGPNFDLISEIASEAFVPMSYGGGIRNIQDIIKIFEIGFDKVVLNSVLYKSPELLKSAAKQFGEQSIIVSIDVRKNFLGKYIVYSHGGSQKQKPNLQKHLEDIQRIGAGEILINSIDRDGMRCGLDTKLIKSVSSKISAPVIACGGAGNFQHLKEAITVGYASAVAAGSMFVFHGKHRAVLISYLKSNELEEISQSTKQLFPL